MSEPGALRVAVIGCGPVGDLHARAIAGSPVAELVGVCDLDLDRARRLGRRMGVRHQASAAELLAGEPPDAVTVATSDDRHVDVVLGALSAGCHVFCEKPLAPTAREARELVEAAERQNLSLGVDHNRRFGFGYETAKRLVSDGTVGRIAHAALSVTDATLPSGRVTGPFNILTTLLTHHIDLLRWLCGEIVSVEAVFAGGESETLRRGVVLSFRFRGGAVGSLTASYRDGQTRTTERLELVGANASLVVRDVTREVVVSRGDPDRSELLRANMFSRADGFFDTVSAHVIAFIDSVRSGEEPPVTGRDGLCGLKIVEAAIESHRRRMRVEISPDDG